MGISPTIDASVLYKSVDSNGHITFSDTPIQGSVTVERISSSDAAKEAESGPRPIYLALADSLDEAVAQANTRVDLAEHALAVARRELVEDNVGLFNSGRLTRANVQQLEFYKRDVRDAHRDLLRVLKQRNAFAPPRPLA